VYNNYAIEKLLIKYHPSQINHSEESNENWYVDGLINFEKSYSGFKELSFNPVSYIMKTNHLQ